MRRALKVLTLAATVALVSAPVLAHAEGYVSPWVAANAGTRFGDFDNGRAGFGVNAGGMGKGVIGGELDFGFSPSFFGTKNDFGSNSVMDFMGNVIVGVPIGGTHGAGIRPFLTGGLGLLRTQVDGGTLTGTLTNVSSSNNMFGWNLGAGVMGYFNDHVGLRGDVKYLRSFEDANTGIVIIDANAPGQFHFWRAAVGVVFR
jgi:outer membrane protein with beta-barrel domain